MTQDDAMQGPVMAPVLAIVADGRPDATVTAVAEALAAVLNGRVKLLPITSGTSVRHAEARVVAELGPQDGMLLVVVGRDAPVPLLWQSLARHVQAPVVVVPPGDGTSQVALNRLLIPLNGSAEATATVAETVELFVRAGTDLLVLHVFDETTAPRFWDQAAHEPHAWEQEFLARFVGQPGARLELRRGRPDEHVLDIAGTERVDLIAPGWSRHLAPGRARTVRETIHDATVPVMLVPIPAHLGT
ncbi:MAG TPA: universal stress protein [Kineosporiaceae bacterium]|nr:universal stress protein [Kineosporiaceae bacterium]